MALATTESIAGSGAGGEITFVNDAPTAMRVTWSGSGCAGDNGMLSLICEELIMHPGESYHYRYNWGVMATWLNISIYDPRSNESTNPCAPISGSKGRDRCIYDHQVVDTRAYYNDVCTLTGRYKNYHLECVRESNNYDNKNTTIQIKTFKDKVLFTHSSENNTLLNTLDNAVRDGTDLTGADLIEAVLRYADLRGAKLRYADFRDANFRDSDFRGAGLRYADFRGADFRGADFRGADFRGADFRGADLTGAKYTPRQINSAITDETTILKD